MFQFGTVAGWSEYTKPWSPVPSDTERVYDQVGGFGHLELGVGGARNLWVKMTPETG